MSLMRTRSLQEAVPVVVKLPSNFAGIFQKLGCGSRLKLGNDSVHVQRLLWASLHCAGFMHIFSVFFLHVLLAVRIFFLVGHFIGTGGLKHAALEGISYSLHAFPVPGPKTWNALPEDVASSLPEYTFRHQLKMWLFKKSFPDIIII